jgi:23S rRNA G2445 N2-methylase RlmL
LVEGSDLDEQVVGSAIANLARLPYGEQVVLNAEDVRHRRRLERATLLANPPYGVRLGDRAGAERAVAALGAYLRERCRDVRAVVYVADPELGGQLGLEPARTLTLTNGGIRGAALGFLL